VPARHLEALAKALARNNIRHTLRVFPGEGHGFHKPETIVAALAAELDFYARTFGFSAANAARPTHS
jgi:dipeptidyl aminopeptidase/acylaminoacyl peptidase